MTEALIQSVKSNLRSQFYHVNHSWLKECVEYYTSEQNDLSLSAVQAFVTSQWLLSDLREINNEQGYLPADFSQQAKTVLPGRYILQVDKMCDISQSKYSQLQKIRNVSETNVKATAIETPAWEPKGKRVMQLWLTDGIQEFTAIEYKPIKKLKGTLLPGFKVMIVGPVTCRRGVIMLTEENYQEIGGEVDSLLKPNALENILARALGMEENETPYAVDKPADEAARIDDNFPEDEFNFDFEELTHIEHLSMENREVPVAVAPRPNIPERTALASKTTVKPISNSTRNNNTMTNHLNRENGSDNNPSNSQKENFYMGDDCFDDIDFDQLEENTSRKYNGTKPTSKPAATEIENKFATSIQHEARTSAGSPRKASPSVSRGKRSSDQLSPLGSTPKMICLKNTPHSSAKQNRKITEFTAIIQPKEEIPPKICDSISDVLKDLSPDTETYTTVRGKVTQVGKLSKRDKYWELKATIDDDTATLDVMFSSQVLEGLIGFTVSEFLAKKKMRKTSPEVEDYLREGFRKAESAIKQMDVLMELELSINNGLPKVVNTTGLTNEQRQLIEKRIKIIAAA